MVISNLRTRLPPLNTLAAFEAASRLGSFTRAAKELNLTQAAISRQILYLENFLGVQLFDRLRHSVVLTKAGVRFADAVNPALLNIGEAAITLKAEQSERLIIRSEFCLATHWLMPRLNRFQELRPKVILKVLTSSQPVEMEDEKFDIALGHGISKSSAIKSFALAAETIVPVCSTSMRQQLLQEATITDLARCPLIHCEQLNDDSMDWYQYFALFDVRTSVAPRLVLSTYTSVIDAAVQGYGFALGWRHTIDDLLKDGRLIELPRLAVATQKPFSVHVMQEKANSPIVRSFVAWLRNEVT
jgi:DNA-binding transcriptional LysR family regulator